MATIEITGTPDLDAVISVADLKAHLRVDHSDEDTLIEAYRDAAIKWVEDYCNTRLGDVTAVMYMDAFFTRSIPVGPVSAISSVTYLDQSGDSQTLDTSYWWADTKRQPARITFDGPPDLFDDTYNAVQVNMTIGYAEASIPKPIIHAIRLMVGHLYESRQAVAYAQSYELPMGLHSILSPYRIVG